MALRSLLRKMPALGVRSLPAAPLMGAVRKLSPAAGSRLMSTDLPSAQEGQVVYSQEELAAQRREEIDLMLARWDQTSKQIQRNIEICAENNRSHAQDLESFVKLHEKIRRTCYAIILLSVPATILVSLV